MNTNKFTPGPWVIKAALGSKGEHCFWDISPASNEDESYRGNVCRVSDAGHICGISLEESRANAQLISAAPDLIAALSMFVAQWNACGPNSEFGRYFRNVRDAAVSAIDKAVQA